MAELLLRKVEGYWAGRAHGYSQSNAAELCSEKAKVWERLIQRQVPAGKTLRVLDVGTGPGFLALVMAGCGHRVTAVDYTEAMIEEARRNAQDLNLDVDFMQMDAQDLDFDDQTFDLVVTRNLTWNLKAPRDAYQEFYRVLCSGGRLLNFDANWYLYLFDDLARDGWEKDRENARIMGYPDHCRSDRARVMESIAGDLPLSRIHRPEWDVQTLTGLGFSQLSIEPDIGKIRLGRHSASHFRLHPHVHDYS